VFGRWKADRWRDPGQRHAPQHADEERTQSKCHEPDQDPHADAGQNGATAGAVHEDRVSDGMSAHDARISYFPDEFEPTPGPGVSAITND
jgi:hypothetical protein